MATHFDRLGEGAVTTVILSIIACVLYLLYVLAVDVVGPFVMDHSTFFSKVTAGLLLFMVISYIVGYMVNDMGEDVSAWLGDADE